LCGDADDHNEGNRYETTEEGALKVSESKVFFDFSLVCSTHLHVRFLKKDSKREQAKQNATDEAIKRQRGLQNATSLDEEN
jgi:hypothetical protein